MIVCFHLFVFLVDEYFTPGPLREVRDITRDVSNCFNELYSDKQVNIYITNGLRRKPMYK